MAYADYAFYTDEYLNGKKPVISEQNFGYYEKQAEAIIKDMTLGKAEDYSGGDEVKMATCAAVDQLYKALADNAEDDENAVPAGVSSEHVGEYSVTYAGNTLEEKLAAGQKNARSMAKIYLGVTGLLFRGIGGN